MDNQEDLVKSLEMLIDESLAEIEELKKSEGRFSASEITIGDSKSGVKEGHDKNGSLDKEEDKEEDKEDEDKKEDKDEDKKDDDMDKGEGANRPADSLTKSVDERFDAMEKSIQRLEALLVKSAPEAEKVEEDLSKSEDKEEDLVKSYVNDKFSALEKKFDSIANTIQEIADAPVASKSVSYKDVQPLTKSVDEAEPLNKSELSDKLFELKKSGTTVNSEDIATVELGGPAELSKIAQKYNIK